MTRVVKRYRDWLEADARSWGVSPRLAWLAYLAPLLGVPLLALAFLNRELFDALLVEDGLAENAQIVLLLGVVLFAALLAVRLRRQQRRSAALVYAVLAAGALFVAIEEISWGQRIFGLATPEALAELNRQDELNIHNIPILQHAFGLGQLVGSFYGLIVPLIVAAGLFPHLTSRLDQAFVPPLFLAGSLLISFSYRLVKHGFFPSGTYVTNRFAEYAELVLYSAVLATVWLGYLRWAEGTARVAAVAKAHPPIT